MTWGGTPDIARLAEDAEKFDLVVIPQSVVADLEKRGKLLDGGSRDFVASAMDATASPGAWNLDVPTRATLRQLLLEAQSVVLSIAFLSLRLAPTARQRVGLVTISVRTCVDGDRLLTLHSEHPQQMWFADDTL